MATDRIVRLDVKVPESLSAELQRVAETENRSADAFVQEAIERALVLKRHRALQEFGDKLAAKRGLTEADVPKLIKETRVQALTLKR